MLLAVFTSISSLVQLIAPDNMRGRVISVYNVAFRGGMPVGSLVVGALVKQFTAPVVISLERRPTDIVSPVFPAGPSKSCNSVARGASYRFKG